MAACRVIIAEGMRACKALGVGDDPTVDELAVGVEALQNLILDLHESRGPLLDVDVPGNFAFDDVPPDPDGVINWTPSENQRIRIQAGSLVTVTLPNAIPLFNMPDPCDYGFNAGTSAPPVGTTSPADGVEYRQPRDGTRIEIVGTVQSLYFYRADLNQWMPATGLLVDTESPLNARYNSALGALLAERLLEVLPDAVQATPGLMRRIARGRAALMVRSGAHRDPVVVDYF